MPCTKWCFTNLHMGYIFYVNHTNRSFRKVWRNGPYVGHRSFLHGDCVSQGCDRVLRIDVLLNPQNNFSNLPIIERDLHDCLQIRVDLDSPFVYRCMAKEGFSQIYFRKTVGLSMCISYLALRQPYEMKQWRGTFTTIFKLLFSVVVLPRPMMFSFSLHLNKSGWNNTLYQKLSWDVILTQ